MIRPLLVLVLALVVAVPGFAATAGAAKTPKPKTIKVGDDFFSPKKLKVKKNTTIKWKWSADNADTHDVRLKKGPKGVKKFHSQYATAGYSFKKKLTKKGTYTLYCSVHSATMRETIVVK
jgi:plastocyanin